VLLLIGIAAANGGNDVAKGVATLTGGRVASYRTAIAWGTVTTFAGAALSFMFAEKLTKLFSKGIFTGAPTKSFAVAVLVGSLGWVALATVRSLPVSTTQAIVGALVGAGLVVRSDAVAWDAVKEKVVQPMLLSVLVAYAISFVLSFVVRRAPECICIAIGEPAVEAVALGGGGAALAFSNGTGLAERDGPRLTIGTVAECRVHGERAQRVGLNVNGLHWLSAGATGFARGLNDTPKLVAVGAFTLVPAGITSGWLVLIVAVAMAAGSLLFGTRVTRRMGDDVVVLDPARGCSGNLVTASLVALAANKGLPLSTTQVATGAIAGTAGTSVSGLNRRTLGHFVMAWTLTPLVAGIVAAAVYAVIGG
jgi:PiT family inorganic phosphate transporter